MYVSCNSLRLSLTLALAASLISSGWARAEDAPGPDCYVLSVGVDNYLNECPLSGDVADAFNNTFAFAGQKGKMFGTVYARTLVDADATRADIMKQMQDFAGNGKTGDYFVIFLSGRANTYCGTGAWYFAPFDEQPNTKTFDVSGQDILKAADVLVKQGKKVVVIANGSFSGRLAQEAEEYLNRYQDARGGGLIVAVSSSPMQTSSTVTCFSPFARAFADGLNGAADLDGDGKVTLQELKTFTYSRTYDFLRMNCNYRNQDSTVTWSRSLSPDSPRAGECTSPVTLAPRSCALACHFKCAGRERFWQTKNGASCWLKVSVLESRVEAERESLTSLCSEVQTFDSPMAMSHL